MNELLPTSYEQLRRSFDDLRYGGFSQYPLIGFGSLTTFDPSRVPEGRATLHAWDYVPYERPDGRSWDETKRDYAERMIDHMGALHREHRCTRTFFSITVTALSTWSAPRRAFGVATCTASRRRRYQSGAHRPTPELGQFTVPGVERLYLVGPFQHPGGGVFGAGRGAAMKFMEDTKTNVSGVTRRGLRRVTRVRRKPRVPQGCTAVK